MNKKNLAMAMAAVTVVGSAAPIFADTTVKEEGYTVVQDKYEKLLKIGEVDEYSGEENDSSEHESPEEA